MPRPLISSGSPLKEHPGHSRAALQGDWMFVSGAHGFDHSAMHLPPRVEEQARQCLENISHALAQGQFSLADVVQLTCILPPGEDFGHCKAVLHNHFGESGPTPTVQSAKLPDPRRRIEIEVMAVRRDQSERAH